MDQLDKEIKKTRDYGRQFGVIYGNDEIKNRLISSRTYSDQSMEEKLSNTKEKITQKSKYTGPKLNKVRQYVNKLSRVFPDILFIAVTGSVAAGYCEQNDDIDLMIVTKNNRLWLNRLLLRMYVWFNKIPHRKFGFKENANELCFNLWIEEGVMKLPKVKRTLRNAMDTILMVPVLNKEKTYERFLATNSWVRKFVANGYNDKISNFKFKISNEKVKTNLLLNLVNWLVFWPQWWYMKGRISTELVGLRLAFFHPNDRIRYAREDNR